MLKINIGTNVKIINWYDKYYDKTGTVVGISTSKNFDKYYMVRLFDYDVMELYWSHDLGIIDNSNNTQCEEGENNMATKLTGFKQVAAIEQGCSTYYYAIYDDGMVYYPGDKVIVSGAARGELHTISEIIDPEEAVSRMGNKNITAEIITRVDTSAYDERLEKRKAADKLKKDMDKVIKQIEENNKYEMYAERNPELAEMLSEYKKLIG